MEPKRTTEAGLRERQAVIASSFVDWGAILSGTFVAVALMATFLQFGLALGLGIAPPASGAERWGMPGWGYAVAMGLWLILTPIASMMSGGYVAGRMRRASGEAADSEVHVRDGVNGVTVWGVASAVIMALSIWSVAGGLSTASSAIGTVVQSAGASPASTYVADLLLRPGAAAAATPGTGKSSGDDAEAVRRIVARAGDFRIDDNDKTFIAQVIARRTGMTDQEARQRIDEVMGRFAQEAEQARRYGVIAAFVAAVAALIAAAAAWSGGVLGGAHRDGRTARELKASRVW